MPPFHWQSTAENRFGGTLGALRVECDPLVGIKLDAGNWQLPRILGLEVVTASGLQPQPLTKPGSIPEAVIRQDVLLAHFLPPVERFVECHGRWRVAAEGVFDLEISALTPGQWEGLAVQTLSQYPGGEVILMQEVSPPLTLYRLPGGELSYAEFCHPHDGVGAHREQDGKGNTIVRYRLFGHDLEKGVILRGRLRGMMLPRVVDIAAALAAYGRFLAEPPHLAW